MKFESKAHMAQELIAGKRFRNNDNTEIFYSENRSQPFRVDNPNWENSVSMSSFWSSFDQDVWTEVKPRHVHQDLIDSYQEGQAWQYRPTCSPRWENCRYRSGGWYKPEWREDVEYRLHPHNELIQAHFNGAEIQYYTHGDDEYCWVDDPTPCWNTYLKYRIKPKQATLYEWMYLVSTIWNVYPSLYTEEDAAEHFGSMVHKKTGRSFEVAV
jgi:hypothetical protein